jgi:hypothetical protein
MNIREVSISGGGYKPAGISDILWQTISIPSRILDHHEQTGADIIVRPQLPACPRPSRATATKPYSREKKLSRQSCRS